MCFFFLGCCTQGVACNLVVLLAVISFVLRAHPEITASKTTKLQATQTQLLIESICINQGNQFKMNFIDKINDFCAPITFGESAALGSTWFLLMINLFLHFLYPLQSTPFLALLSHCHCHCHCPYPFAPSAASRHARSGTWGKGVWTMAVAQGRGARQRGKQKPKVLHFF